MWKLSAGPVHKFYNFTGTLSPCTLILQMFEISHKDSFMPLSTI